MPHRPVPSTVTGNTGVPFVTGTYRPANSGTTDLFPAPAPAAPYTYTLSAFNGDSPERHVESLRYRRRQSRWRQHQRRLDDHVRRPARRRRRRTILITEFRTRGAGTTPPGSGWQRRRIHRALQQHRPEHHHHRCDSRRRSDVGNRSGLAHCRCAGSDGDHVPGAAANAHHRRPSRAAAARIFPDLDAAHDAEPGRQYLQPLDVSDRHGHHGQRQRQHLH